MCGCAVSGWCASVHLTSLWHGKGDVQDQQAKRKEPSCSSFSCRQNLRGSRWGWWVEGEISPRYYPSFLVPGLGPATYPYRSRTRRPGATRAQKGRLCIRRDWNVFFSALDLSKRALQAAARECCSEQRQTNARTTQANASVRSAQGRARGSRGVQHVTP